MAYAHLRNEKRLEKTTRLFQSLIRGAAPNSRRFFKLRLPVIVLRTRVVLARRRRV